MRGTWYINPSLKGIEIIFDSTPSTRMLALLNKNGFRFSSVKSLWWNKNTQLARNFANEIADFGGEKEEQKSNIILEYNADSDEVSVTFSKYSPSDDYKRAELIQTNFKHNETGRKWVAKRNVLTMLAANRIAHYINPSSFLDQIYLNKFENSFPMIKLSKEWDNLNLAIKFVVPEYTRIKSNIDQGLAYPVDISSYIIESLQVINELNSKDISVYEFLNSNPENLSPITKELLHLFDNHKKNTKRITDYLLGYIHVVDSLGSPKKNESRKNIYSVEDVLAATIERVESDNAKSILFNLQYEKHIGNSKFDRSTRGKNYSGKQAIPEVKQDWDFSEGALGEVSTKNVSTIGESRNIDTKTSESTTEHRTISGNSKRTTLRDASNRRFNGNRGEESTLPLDRKNSVGDGARNDSTTIRGGSSQPQSIVTGPIQNKRRRRDEEFEHGEYLYHKGKKVEFCYYTVNNEAVVLNTAGNLEIVNINELDEEIPESKLVVRSNLEKGTDDFRAKTQEQFMGGSKTKYKNNIRALKILHSIESERRSATDNEKQMLAKYVGWGGLSNVFNKESKEWEKEYQELRQLIKERIITEDEYERARRGTLDEFYTPSHVIKSMYHLLDRLGFQGGKILEPSMGVGNFFSLMPNDMIKNSERTGIEIDSLSGRISRILYPNSHIHIQGFEDIKIPDGTFDLTIGNIPFGDIQVTDGNYSGNLQFVKKRIHNYFFAKALDKTRDGGLILFVTSSGILNAAGNKKMRQYIADKADFLGAIRLPKTTFKSAGTQVTSDIIVLQKRSKNQQPNHVADFIELLPSNVIGKNGVILKDNEYFQSHPTHVLGTYAEDTLFGNRLAVEDNGRSINELITNFPENVYKKNQSFLENPTSKIEIVDTQELSSHNLADFDEFNFINFNGEVYQKINEQLTPISVGSNKERIMGLILIRDEANRVLNLQKEGATDEELTKAQISLNSVYDNFRMKYGIVNDPANIKAFKDDIMGSALVRSLEKNINQQKNGKKVVYIADKESIFTERTIHATRLQKQVENPQEALIISLFEKGKVDWDFMSTISNTSQDTLKKELRGFVFKNPQNKRWETADEYLSGNVREKLKIAIQAAKEDDRYKENLEALEGVQPEWLTPAQIVVRLGAPWIPSEDICEFVNSLIEVSNKIDVNYEPLNAVWSVKERNNLKTLNYNTKNTEEYGVKNPRGRNITAIEMVENALNLKIPTVTYRDEDDRQIVDIELTNEARAKQKQIQDIFQDWIWSDPERAERLSSLYNEQFNSMRLREYDGEAVYGKGIEEKIPIPGLNVKYKLRPHQKNAIWRVTQGGNTLLAHVVGAGKTLEMIVSGMEMKRLGLINKPMYVVPNHLLDQWEKDFIDAYPGAKILKISNDGIPTVNARRTKGISDEEYIQRVEENRIKRRIALNKIVVGNFDAILITHSTFQKLPMSPETVREHISEQVKEVEAAIVNASQETGTKRPIKQLEKTKANLEARLKENLEEEKKDVAIPFEELGIDQIFVDEAHLFKNLKFHTKMTRVAGLPQTNSKRSQDMFLKTQWLTRKTGRGVVFATGTPISNTMAEMFTLQRYLQMDTLKKLGIAHFDAWAALFGESVTGIEMDATGKFKQKTRFARFHNVGELMQMFRSFADIKTADMLNLPVPQNIVREMIVAPMSEEQHSYLIDLADRAEQIKNGRVSPDEDNYLKLTGDGRKSALDIRLVDPTITWDNPDSKTNYCVEKVHGIWKETKNDRLTQLIFLDLGTPKKKNLKDNGKDEESEHLSENGEEEFSQVYEDIKIKLIRKGIPENEISFIHDAKTDKQRLDLFDKVRNGDVRILIGSTEKMGAGMNVQTRLKALHHLDAPWRPADVEQREGRIIRQGNINNTVEIYTYTTEGSFDAIMWDTLKRKATFIAQVMNGSANVRSLEDVEELVLGYAQVAAVTSGNPLFLEKHEIDQKVLELQSLKTSYERNKRKYQEEILRIPPEIEKREDKVQRLKKDLISRKDTRGNLFQIEINGQIHTDRNDAGSILNDLYNLRVDNMNYGKMESIGKFAGFELLMGKGMGYTHFLKGEVMRGFDLGHSPTGTIQKMEHCIRKIEEDIQDNEEYIKYIKSRKEDLKKIVDKPFDKADELKQSLARQAELLKLLTDLDGENNAVLDNSDSKIEQGKPKVKKLLFEVLTELGKNDSIDPHAVRYADMPVESYSVKKENDREFLVYQIEGEKRAHTIVLNSNHNKEINEQVL